ncbi:MAG: LCP family protein, partial [Solirubrobacteraceae bacterium]
MASEAASAQEPPRSGSWMARRFLVGALAIVVLSGAGTAAFALGEVNKVVEALRQHKQVKVSHAILAPTSKGEPETLLLVGNDERPLSKFNHNEVLPHSNEMLLVRIDPTKPTISMMSIPRELWVPIHKPDGEIEENRINSAYTFGYLNGGGTSGGVKLMVSTIKEVLGIPTINYVFVTNFKRFEHAVQEMGCVYMTVDKHYEHTNEPYGEQYFEIHLAAGYQRLCGHEALEYVANRHESTSLVRDARDQRFLLETKAQYGPTLFENREKFEHVFGKAIETNLHGEEEVLSLLELLIESAGKPVRQVHFDVTFAGSHDTATPEQIHSALHSFLTGTAPIANRRLTGISSAHGGQTPHGRHQSSPTSSLSALSLSPTPSSTLAEGRAQASQLPFAIEMP